MDFNTAGSAHRLLMHNNEPQSASALQLQPRVWPFSQGIQVVLPLLDISQRLFTSQVLLP